MSETASVEFQSVTPNMLVSDLPAAARFYAEKLGFEIVMDATEENFVALARGNVTLSVLGSKTQAGTGRCSFIVTNPAILFAQYQQAGVTIFRPLETWGEHPEFSIKDPDGNRIDIGNPMF